MDRDRSSGADGFHGTSRGLTSIPIVIQASDSYASQARRPEQRSSQRLARGRNELHIGRARDRGTAPRREMQASRDMPWTPAEALRERSAANAARRSRGLKGSPRARRTTRAGWDSEFAPGHRTWSALS